MASRKLDQSLCGTGANPEASELAQRVEELASPFEPVQNDLLEALLCEIDNIMLPREVHILLDDGQEQRILACMIISQRRLLEIALPGGWRGDLIDAMRELLVLLRPWMREQTSHPGSIGFRRIPTQAPIGAESLSVSQIRRRFGSASADR